MVRYENLTQKPELFRAPWARDPLGPGPGTMYPLNPPLAGPGYNTSHASKNICFRPRGKKCITQNLLAFRGFKLWTNIDDAYKNNEFSTATFKKHYKKFLISKY